MMDKQYWNAYYREENLICEPTLFCKEIVPHLKHGGRILELGCGNGRDCLYFEKIGLGVTAIDFSDVAINRLRKVNENITFIEGDFVCKVQKFKNYFDYIYSRFTLHSISAIEQIKLFDNCFKALKSEGIFFIETRSVKDEIFGLGKYVEKNAYIYNDHYRRFQEIIEIEEELKSKGFSIHYSCESREFAPYKNEAPQVIRIIAKKCK